MTFSGLVNKSIYSFREQEVKSELRLCFRQRETARGLSRLIQSIAASFFLLKISVVAFRYDADSWLSSVKISFLSGSTLHSPFDLIASISECIDSTIYKFEIKKRSYNFNFLTWSLQHNPGLWPVFWIKVLICSIEWRYKIPEMMILVHNIVTYIPTNMLTWSKKLLR